MKLSKRLLSIATASAASVAAITPFTTSCGKNNTYVTDGKSIYIPTIERAMPDSDHPEGYTNDEARDLYYDHITNNPEVFYEDVKASVSNFIYYYVDKGAPVSEAKVSINLSGLNVSTTDETISLAGEIGFYEKKLNIPFTKKIQMLNCDVQMWFEITDLSYSFEYVNTSAKIIPINGWWLHPSLIRKHNQNESPRAILKANGYVFPEGIGPSGFCQFDNEEITIDDFETIEQVDVKWTSIVLFIEAFVSVLGSHHMANIPYNMSN